MIKIVDNLKYINYNVAIKIQWSRESGLQNPYHIIVVGIFVYKDKYEKYNTR